MENAPLFAIVAGEISGDRLGVNLIQSLKAYFPHARFIGIGGEGMIAEGLISLFPLETLSVMGFIEPLKRLPQLLFIQKKIEKKIIHEKPHAFIGIDAPDFNLRLSDTFHQHGIKTVHYVSPTVWAWRKGRIKKIKKSIDLMLTLFPFEQKIYEENHISVRCVGHPLADAIPLVSDKAAARKALGLPEKAKILALLPGSRAQELRYLAKPFIETACWLAERVPSLIFISACASKDREIQLQAYQKQIAPQLPLHLFKQRSTQVMTAADLILVGSGTATLEAMLVKRPTVVAYKMSPFTFAIAKRLIKVPYIALPNLLANQMLMPEYIQRRADPSKMGEKLLKFLNNREKEETLIATFTQCHLDLKRQAGKAAAQAIVELIAC